MEVIFNPKSPRAEQARIGRSLAKWTLALDAAVILLIVGGFTLVLLGWALGWAVVGFAAVPAMVVEWYKRGLKKLPALKDGVRVDDIIDSDILGQLPTDPTPQQIAEVVGATTGGMFFAVRFGVSGNFLRELSSTDRTASTAVWTEALAIANQTTGRIGAGALLLALLRQVSSRQTLLGHLQLDEDDLIRGIHWYHHLEKLVEARAGRPKRPGGIGRDWSFGWIPTLSRFGQNISGMSAFTPDVRGGTLAQLYQQLVETGRRSVALVGPTGVGKTEVMYELAGELMDPASDAPDGLRYHQVFMLDATTLLASASGRGELEGLVETILGEAYSAKNIIVFLDNAELFFDESVGSVDLSKLLLPILEAGRLPIVLSVDEQRYLQIVKRQPALVGAMNRVNVHPTSESDSLRVMQDKLITIEFQRKVTYMYQALREAYVLGKRYVYDIAMPGQAISLLESSAEYAESGLVTAKSVARAIESSIGVKTKMVEDDGERDMLLNLESLIHERMIGQTRAVSVVSDALRRARAGVRNQQRPVGTFLFLGPTGVGKTELAKSLAAVYYGGEDKIIRLDMNEYVGADDVARLIADGTDDPNSLTAQIMKQPFSVILLDEIEKAHSSVLSTLLQLLDEGILRDVRNREVSFRDAIIIATSNAGADRIQEFLHRGYKIEQFEDQFISELIDTHIFHPEFLNRFDEMIVFTPLDKSELLKVVDLILADVNKNLAAQKVTVVVADDAKEYLVEAGYDPRLGARPMRRIIQRTVENMVAKQMLSQEVDAGGVVEIGLEQVRALIEKKKQADDLAKDAV